MFDDLLAANATYAAGFSDGDLPRQPARRLTVVTCMDARIDVYAALGLSPGDAHVLRNAGGRVTSDVLRSLFVSTHLLGVRSIVVMHHTACGMADLDPDEVRARTRSVPREEWAKLDLLPIDDPLRDLADDVALVRGSALLGDVEVAGFMYDVATGAIDREA
jgi:carbonic anhydrase